MSVTFTTILQFQPVPLEEVRVRAEQTEDARSEAYELLPRHQTDGGTDGSILRPEQIKPKKAQRRSPGGPKKIVVLGDSHAGKSSLINVVVGKNVASVGAPDGVGDKPCTTRLKAFKVGGGAKADSGDYFVDTIGISSEFNCEYPRPPESQINKAAFSDACKSLYDVFQPFRVGISKIILVVKVDRRMNTLLEPLLQGILGNDFHKNTILVINRADNKAKDQTTVEEYLTNFREESPVKKFVEKFMDRTGGRHNVFLTCLRSVDPLAASETILRNSILARMEEDCPPIYLRSRGGFWEFLKTHVFPFFRRLYHWKMKEFDRWCTAMKGNGEFEFPDQDCCICCGEMIIVANNSEDQHQQLSLVEEPAGEERAPLLLTVSESHSQVFISKCCHVFHSACVREMVGKTCPFCRQAGFASLYE